jgi:hypothetical protein
MCFLKEDLTKFVDELYRGYEERKRTFKEKNNVFHFILFIDFFACEPGSWALTIIEKF